MSKFRDGIAASINQKEKPTMAEAGTLHDAFIDELRDTYDAEKPGAGKNSAKGGRR